MGEIGSGGGSSYPAALDTDNVQETASDFVRLQWGNDVAADIVAIEATLGVNPQGIYATVAARLAALAIGAVGVGASSARPAASAGGWYYSTDIGVLEFSDGANWHAVLTG